MERKSGVILDKDYPNYIAPYNLKKLSERHHPLGNFPQYPTDKEPEQFFEEVIAGARYQQLVDEYRRIYETKSIPLPGMDIMMRIANGFRNMVMAEMGHYDKLIEIAENTIRQYYHLDKTEVLFDLELINPMSGDKPADQFEKRNNGEDMDIDIDDPEYKPDFRDELIRRRLTNSLIQGAALKGHYIFHLANEPLNQVIPGITKVYNKAMVVNDLNYYYIDDVTCSSAAEDEAEAGMMEVDFSGDVPVIKARSMCFTVLVHEMIKGVMEVLTAHGLPKNPVVCKNVIDLCDTVLNEFWDIRIGPKYWEMLFSQVGSENHEFLKHVIVGICKQETPDFLQFMKELFAGSSYTKTFIDNIISKKKAEIAEYSIAIKEFNSDEIDTSGIDWSSLE